MSRIMNCREMCVGAGAEMACRKMCAVSRAQEEAAAVFDVIFQILLAMYGLGFLFAICLAINDSVKYCMKKWHSRRTVNAATNDRKMKEV